MTPEIYEIELTQQEIEQALLEAKKKKLQKIKNEEYLSRINYSYKPIELNAAQYYNYIVNNPDNEGLSYKDSELSLFYGMVCHFTRDSRATKHFDESGFMINEYSIEKGICFIGECGVGKTTLMRLFQQNTTNPFWYKSAKEIAFDYQKNGIDAVKGLGIINETKSGFGTKSNPFNQKLFGLFIDDFGAENITKNYGNEIEPVAEVIELRYSNQLPYRYTNISTNLTMDEILDRYGKRLYDRFYEMFNIIHYKGDSKR